MSSTYNNTKELRFWCQKVLPLVYDDSLSYYELLNKIVVYLNSTIEDVQAMIADVTRIEQGLSSKIDLTQKGVPNGVATLNAQGQVPLTQLPDISAGVQTISVNGVNVPADANKNVNIIVMTNAVSNLVNYYLKSETYNKTEVNALIDSVKNSRFEVVAQLPTTDIQTNVIYLVPKSVGQTQNGYDEFINLDGTTSGWELIGSTDIDLSGYVTDSELATALSAYVTTQSLNTTLAGYVTSGALATTLEGYVTQLSFQSLQNTVTSQGNTLAGLITTVNSKVDKVAGKGLSTNDYSNTDKGIVDKIQDNVIANAKLIKDTVGWSGKNLCPNKATTKTTNGITFTVNSDGSITVNGTATADATLFLTEPNEIPLTLNGTYILSAGAVLDNDFKFTMEAPQGTNNNVESSALTKSFNNVAVNNFRVFVRNGKTVNNITIFPMLYNADILDDTYEPYFGSTAFPRSEQVVLGAVNLLKNTRGTETIRGVTFTVQSNETIDINGTQDNTGDGSEYVINGQNANGKRLKLSDYPNNLVYDIGVAYDNTNVLAGIWYYDENETYLGPQTVSAGQTGFVLSPPTGAVYFLPFIRALKNTTVNHVTVYPMFYPLSISKPPFAPFAMTNRQLTNAIQGITVKSFTSEQFTITAGQYSPQEISIANGNLTPLGIVGYRIDGNGNTECGMWKNWIDNTTTKALLSVKNFSANATATITVTIFVLYKG